MDRLDPVLDTDVLIAAWRAALRGSTSAKDHAALTLLHDPNHAWILTPTVYKEFTKVVTGSASRKRFLRKLANVSLLTTQAAVLKSGSRFIQVFAGLRQI